MSVLFALHRSFKIGILRSFSLRIFQTLFKSTEELLSLVEASVVSGGDTMVGITEIRSNFGVTEAFVLVSFLAGKNFHILYL